jgi:hypothetical protein
MMTLARAIRDAAEALARSEGGHCSETPQALYVNGTLTDGTLNQWRQIAFGLVDHNIGVLIAIDSFGNSVDLRIARIEDLADPIRIIVEKAQTEGAARLFLPSSIAVLLEDQDASRNARNIYIADDFAPFSAASCLFSVWDTAISPVESQAVANIDPRRFVRDFTGEASVPKGTGIYILDSAPKQDSSVFRIWSDAARKYLPLCLVNELWEEKGVRMASLIGPRTRRIPLGVPDPTDAELFRSLQDASKWVYLDSRDVEVKHTLFTNELAREWPEGPRFYEQFSLRAPKALDSAKTAYRAHLRNESKETLKSLTDLRKALSEEVSKVSAQTRELVGTLWRDFAIAMAAVLSRIALIFADKQPSADSLPMKTVLVGTAVFLLVDLAITLKTNARFMRIAAESRSVWGRKLYGFLSDDDVKFLAEDPIQESIETYNQAKWAVIGIYVVVIIVLLGISFPTERTALSDRAERIWHPFVQRVFR